MRSFETRLRRLEAMIPERPCGEFDVDHVLSFRVAGMPRCLVQALEMLILEDMRQQPTCPAEVRRDCQQRIAARIPAFLVEMKRPHSDSRLDTEECKTVLELARELIPRFEESVKVPD